MLYVDGMNGVIAHAETIQWLYTLVGSKFRLVVKTTLKLLLVLVEYSESNAPLLIDAITSVETKRGCKSWSNTMEILQEKDGVDTELLVYAMTLINKTLAALPDQDSFYDMVDGLEEQGIDTVSQRHLGRRGTDLDLVEQLNIYEMTLRHEDGDDDSQPPPMGRRDRRRVSLGGGDKKHDLERRRSRRASLGRTGHASPCSPASPQRGLQSVYGQRAEDMSESPATHLPSTAHRSTVQSITITSRKESLREEEQRNQTDPPEVSPPSRGSSRPSPERMPYLPHSPFHLFSYDLDEEPSPPAPPKPSEESPKTTTSPRNGGLSSYSSLSTPSTPTTSRPALGGLLSSSYRQHQESLAADRDYVDKMEEARLARDERYKNVERQAAEEYEREHVRVSRTRPDLGLTFEPAEAWPSSSRSSTPSSFASHEDADADLEAETPATPYTASETGEAEDSSAKRQNEEVNEKDNCSASSISSASSTLEREERGVNDNGLKESEEDADVQLGDKQDSEHKADKSDHHSNIRPLAERFGNLIKDLSSIPPHHDVPANEPPPPPPKKESDSIWDQLLASPRELRIGDINFTDLTDEDDKDILDAVLMGGCGCCPPPPPCFGATNPAPPPSEPPLFNKKKKTIRLFWSEVRPTDPQYRDYKRSGDSFWSKLDPVKMDTAKLEHLFETKSKEMPVTKKTAADGKRTEIIVLDSKRSNAINIGLTVLPPPRTIKTAILNFDEYALNKEGIEKILTMIPTEEEKQKIQEAQLANPDVPLGSAEQFLLTLSSISELSARLQLWAFKMDYETIQKEVAEPLQDLKEGMEQLEKNNTLRYILATLLSMGNFLNGTNAKGFELTYLEKVSEVKDTVHKQSLLHHACSVVVENFPQSTDLYSEIGAITRSAKVDFDQLQENLCQMERRCKASWDHLKVIAKHEMKPQLKQKMSDFLKDCAERIIILKIVHRRIINRFHSFLLFLGHPAYSVREISVHRFSKILSEFALEYRTTRDRVLQQKQKRADHRERNKTRGKMIMDVNAPSDDEEESECARYGSSSSTTSAPSGSQECEQPQGLGHTEDAAEHEHMKAMLRTTLSGGDKEASAVPGLRTRMRSRPGRGGRIMPSRTPPVEDTPIGGDDDADADEIMERIVRSATQGPAQPRERRRSRANRKSLRRTLKNGLTPEEALALGLSDSPDG
ncbi:hypothetical protein KUCAC02_011247 [Chaenocephalus aceratus]|uniref:Uncharacterized protein n=1 Tax=Chaenocephalus aceratus TaxID=36190 RepID=A0ACB9WX13_CHAAC|nr:hypothetical protein KUCAC02_011247 [Chaenocephalus aceratus]